MKYDALITFASVYVARIIRTVAAKAKVEPVALAGAIRVAVLALLGLAGSVLGVTVSPAALAVIVAVLVAAETAVGKAVRAAVTPNDRVVVSQAELDELDAELAEEFGY
jgi:hypothetical protein